MKERMARRRSNERFIRLGVGTASFFLLTIGLAFLAFAGASLVDLEILPAVFLATPGYYLCKWAVELFLSYRKPPGPELFAQSGGKPALPLATRIILGFSGTSLGLLGLCGVFGIRDPILLPLLPLLFVGLYLLRLAERRTPVEPLWLLFPPFIRVAANGDISCFRSVDSLARSLEPLNVRNEAYRVFDSLGSPLELRIEREKIRGLPWFLGGETWRERVNPVRSQKSPDPAQLRAVLQLSLAAIPGTTSTSSAQLEELIASATDHFGLE